PREVAAQAGAGALGGGRAVFGGERSQQGGHGPAIDLAHWAVVQRLRGGAQMPLGFPVAARSQVGLLEGEIAREQGAESFDRSRWVPLLCGRRCAAQRPGGEHVLCAPTRFPWIERGYGSERHAAGLAAVIVLDDPLL